VSRDYIVTTLPEISIGDVYINESRWENDKEILESAGILYDISISSGLKMEEYRMKLPSGLLKKLLKIFARYCLYWSEFEFVCIDDGKRYGYMFVAENAYEVEYEHTKGERINLEEFGDI
jgi:hypothetical protein